MDLVLIIIVLVAVVWSIAAFRSKKRRERLMKKYGDELIVENIMKKRIWQGMTEGQLLDSWGRPAEKDQRIYKTKSAETFKYNQTGRNRFRSRVVVEDGMVVGWSQK
jgi:hypothetical protein